MLLSDLYEIKNFIKDFDEYYKWFSSFKLTVKNPNYKKLFRPWIEKINLDIEKWLNFIIRNYSDIYESDFFEFGYYLKYIKSELDWFKSNNVSLLDSQRFLSLIGQRLSQLFLYIYQCIEKLCFNNYLLVNKDGFDQKIKDAETELKANPQDAHNIGVNYIIKPLQNIDLNKNEYIKKLKGSTLWGSREKCLGIQYFRNIRIHQSIMINNGLGNLKNWEETDGEKILLLVFLLIFLLNKMALRTGLKKSY